MYYFDENGANWEISSVAFNDFYSSSLYWGPTKIWDPSLETTEGTDRYFKGDGGEFPFDLNHFRIFVNSDQSFSFQTAALNTKWENPGNVKDIRTVELDKDNPYFASLMAAYVISQKTGTDLHKALERRPGRSKDHDERPSVLRLVSHESIPSISGENVKVFDE